MNMNRAMKTRQTVARGHITSRNVRDYWKRNENTHEDTLLRTCLKTPQQVTDMKTPLAEDIHEKSNAEKC